MADRDLVIGRMFLDRACILTPINAVLSATRPRIELHPEKHVYRAPVTQHLDWQITADHRRPDGVLKRVYLINGKCVGGGEVVFGVDRRILN
jgi:hypothetical protein